MNVRAYLICIDLNGRCLCSESGRAPCAAMEDIVENDLTAKDEIERIETERAAADQDDF